MRNPADRVGEPAGNAHPGFGAASPSRLLRARGQCDFRRGVAMSALLADMSEVLRLQSCVELELTAVASFELSVRRLPRRCNFLVAAGLEQALRLLKSLSFSEAEFVWLRDVVKLSVPALDYARRLRFEGDVDALPEGTVFFPGEPILRVTAPLPLAQLAGSRLTNVVGFETAVATHASRALLAAPEHRWVDRGLRQVSGAEAVLLAARASYLAGFAGTTTADAARRFGVPLAHLSAAVDASCNAESLLAGLADVADDAGRPEGEPPRSRQRSTGLLERPGGISMLLDTSWQLRGYAGRERPWRHGRETAWPGPRQVYRELDAAGRIAADTVALDDEPPVDGEALLRPFMRAGTRVGNSPSLDESRSHRARQIESLPEAACRLATGIPCVPILVSSALAKRMAADAPDAAD